jgi:excisionase family DNA binding protein
MRQEVNANADGARWLTVREVAKTLKISTTLVIARAKAGQIPCFKLVTRFRFRESDIDDLANRIESGLIPDWKKRGGRKKKKSTEWPYSFF